jgi:predicted transcriptional regulator
LIPSVLLIVAIIPISYYFISQSLEKKLENNMIVISKLIKKNNSVSTKSPTEIGDKNIILKFLNPSERKVIERLIETKGNVLQSEISRIEGMTKLKTHRAVKDLERKGIIKRESYGKTHRIILSKDIKDLMSKG